MKQDGQEETKTDWKTLLTTLTYFIENLAKLMAPKVTRKFAPRLVARAKKLHEHLVSLRKVVRAIISDKILDEGAEIRSVATLYETKSVTPPAVDEGNYPLYPSYDGALVAAAVAEDFIRSAVTRYEIDPDVHPGSLGIRYLVGGRGYQIVCNVGEVDYYLQRTAEGIPDAPSQFADTNGDVELTEKFVRGEIKCRLQAVIASLQGDRLLSLIIKVSSVLVTLPWVNRDALKRNCLSFWNFLHRDHSEMGDFNTPAYATFSTDEVSADALRLPTCRGDPTGELKSALLGAYDDEVPFRLFEQGDPTFTNADLAWLERMTRHPEFHTHEDMHRKIINVNDTVVIFPSPMLATGLTSKVFDYSRDGFNPRDMAAAFLSFSPNVDGGMIIRLYVSSETEGHHSPVPMEINSRTLYVYPEEDTACASASVNPGIEHLLQCELASAFRSICRDIYKDQLKLVPDADDALDSLVMSFTEKTADLYIAYVDSLSSEMYSHVAQSFNLHLDRQNVYDEDDGTKIGVKLTSVCFPHGIVRVRPSQNAEFIESFYLDLDAPDSLPMEIIENLCEVNTSDDAMHHYDAADWIDLLEIPLFGPSEHFLRIYEYACGEGVTDFPHGVILSTGSLGLMTDSLSRHDWTRRSTHPDRSDVGYASVVLNPPAASLWDHASVCATRARDLEADSYMIVDAEVVDEEEE